MRNALSNVLAQGQPPPSGEILGLIGWIFGLAVLAAVVAFVLRLWLKRDGDVEDATAGLGFTLADLRAMRDQGQLDEAEYEVAKAKLTGGTAAIPPGPTREPPKPAGSDGIVWEKEPPPADG